MDVSVLPSPGSALATITTRTFCSRCAWCRIAAARRYCSSASVPIFPSSTSLSANAASGLRRPFDASLTAGCGTETGGAGGAATAVPPTVSSDSTNDSSAVALGTANESVLAGAATVRFSASSNLLIALDAIPSVQPQKNENRRLGGAAEKLASDRSRSPRSLTTGSVTTAGDTTGRRRGSGAGLGADRSKSRHTSWTISVVTNRLSSANALMSALSDMTLTAL